VTIREVVDLLAEQHAELEGLLAGRDDAEWRRPTPCEGWTVADVVLHLAQTDEFAIASAEHRLPPVEERDEWVIGNGNTVDDAAGDMVAAERDQPTAAIHERWRSGAERLRAALRAVGPHERVNWVVGDFSVRTLTTTRLAETWIHTGDVAHAFGVEPQADDRLWHIARLAWRTLPYAFSRAGRELRGPVAFALDAPGEGRWDLVPSAEPATSVHGPALDLCLVAARRLDPADSTLRAEGTDADAVLELVRTYA
jgi:uncharacterized protein (TIGR03084 family)